MAEQTLAKLLEKITLRIRLEMLTGLHIGGKDGGLGLGGADRLVIREPANGRPYLPGSSLKGKLRSLVERAGFAGRLEIQTRGDGIECPPCQCGECAVCWVFGVPADARRNPQPGRPCAGAARLLVRDGSLTNADEVARYPQLDMGFTEVKTEVSIDRLTSAVSPRRLERVPAGACFESQWILNVFENDPREDLLACLVAGLRLLSADSLGGQGSRGYGAVRVGVTGASSLRIEGGRLEWSELPRLGDGLELPLVFDLARVQAAA